MATQPPQESLQPWLDLAQALRNAAQNKDYVVLGRLVAQNLELERVDMMIYIRSPLGNLTLVGAFVDFWSPLIPSTISREPSLEEMALILRAAARR